MTKRMMVKMSQFRLANVLLIAGFFLLIIFYVKIHYQMAQLEEKNAIINRLISQMQRHGENDWPQTGDKEVEENRGSMNQTFKDMIVIYNRVPKTGSTSFMGLAYDLCTKNSFNVLHLNVSKNSHVMTLPDQARFVYNVTEWKSRQPALYHGHIAFLDFAKFGVSRKPIYINLIRKPLDRLVSYYYFLRNGDDFRPYLVRRRSGDKMTFDECVERQERDCHPDNMWLQIPFFCGHLMNCWVPGSGWALQQAKHNLVQHYLLVGVTEELHDFVAVLEATLPSFFNGSLKLYEEGKKNHLRKTFNKIAPAPETVVKIQQSKVWQMENEFYEFALQQFDFVRQRIFSKTNIRTAREIGQQFLFEKIRPR